MAESDYRLMMERKMREKEVLDPCILPEDTVYRIKELETTLTKEELNATTSRRYNGFQIPTQRVYVRAEEREGRD